MPYEYRRLMRMNKVNSGFDMTEENQILSEGFKIHSEQTIPLYEDGQVVTLTLFERYVEEEVIPPEPMRCK